MAELTAEQVAERYGVSPELAREALARLEKLEIPRLSAEELESARFGARCILAGQDNAGAFHHFYWCFQKREPPPYVTKIWIPKIYRAWKEHRGVLLDAFRGGTKSTVLMLWVLWVTGIRPVGSSVLARLNDDAAAETGNAMAAIIEFHPAWKKIFPNIVPDKERGWSSKGYHLKDATIDYGEWVGQCVNDHLGEPSILCSGVTGGDIIGKHPSNGWYFDDLVDEKISQSVREMNKLISIFESDIIPTWTRPEGHPALVGACTLWTETDVYHSILKTGLFEHVKTPIFELDEQGGEIYTGITHNGKRIRLAWPEKFPVERIVELERRNPIQFLRMCLCDLSAMKGLTLKREWLHLYDATKIGSSWPVYFGIDFASTEDRLKDRERDYFALAIGTVIPGGGVILTGGFRDKLSMGEAVAKVRALAGMYPTLQMIGVEKWGKGEEFKNQLLYSTSLPILPLPYAGAPVQSKGKRFQEGLGALFMSGRAWVSDAGDDFISAFNDEWIGWDGGKSRTGHDDTLDAVYWMCFTAAGHLMPVLEQDPANGIRRKERRPNPFAEFAKI